MLFKILTNPVVALSIVISLVILSVPIIPTEVTEISYKLEPLSFEITSPIRYVTKTEFCLPQIICTVIEAHQSIKNTDNLTGIFYLNFVFNNSIEKKSVTESVGLLPGEEKEVFTDVPFPDQVDAVVNVIPPKKSVPEKKVITKNVSAWSILGSVINPFD